MGTSAVLPDDGKQKNFTPNKYAQKERELIRREAEVGATLFGTIPMGHHREFFCLDRRTWIWFEEWYDVQTKTNHQMQVRYEFQPRGVLKTVDGVHNGYVEGQELTNLLVAIKQYHDRVAQEVYGYSPSYA
jgi:hypothetical protein